LLAGIHVVVAAATLVQQEAGVWKMIKADADQSVSLRLAAIQEDETITFNICDGSFIGEMSPQEKVVSYANLPVMFAAGWHQPCMAASPLSAFVGERLGRNTHQSEIVTCSIYCVLVFAEWLLIGGLPVVRPRRWWLEPGALITICTALSFVLALIPHIQETALFPMFVVLLAWLCWFFILIWKALRFGWRRWVVRAEVN
jgi:hypothetical protein